MNLARLFAYTRRVEDDLDRERQAHAQTRQEAAEERRILTDAFARARGASPVYAPMLPPEDPFIGKPAIGPSAVASRELAKRTAQERIRRHPVREPTEEEIEAAAREIVAKGSNGEAEPAEPIAPDKLI